MLKFWFWSKPARVGYLVAALVTAMSVAPGPALGLAVTVIAFGYAPLRARSLRLVRKVGPARMIGALLILAWVTSLASVLAMVAGGFAFTHTPTRTWIFGSVARVLNA